MTAGLLEGAMGKNRQQEIEAWLKRNPRPRVKAPEPEGKPQVQENFDRVQIGQTWGTYRRKKHQGSDGV